METSMNQKVIYITVLGASGAGKTSIISQFMNQTLQMDNLKPHYDVYKGVFKTDNLNFIFRILDTTNYEGLPATRQLGINCSDAIIIVCSLTDESSFQYAGLLNDQIRSIRKTVPVIIVGNKSDLKPDISMNEQIVREAIVNMDWGCPYIETSAKNNINISEVFHSIFLNKQPSSSYCKLKRVPQPKRLSMKIKNFFS